MTAQLTDEFCDLVPATLIQSAVQTASTGPDVAPADDTGVASTARADVEALAEAVRRRTDASEG